MTSWCPLAFRRTSTAAPTPRCLHCTLCLSRRCPKSQKKLRSAAGLHVPSPSTCTIWKLWLRMDRHAVCSSSISKLPAALHGAAACHVMSVDFLQLSIGLQPLMSPCMHQAAGKLCREHSKLTPCMPAAISPHDGSLYAACECSSASCCIIAAPPCSFSMQGFRRSQIPAIKDVKVGQLVSKRERCRVYRGTFQGKAAVIKVGRPTKPCLTAAPIRITALLTPERPCLVLAGLPGHQASLCMLQIIDRFGTGGAAPEASLTAHLDHPHVLKTLKWVHRSKEVSRTARSCPACAQLSWGRLRLQPEPFICVTIARHDLLCMPAILIWSSVCCPCTSSSPPLTQALIGTPCAADACLAAAHDLKGWWAAARIILCGDRCCPRGWAPQDCFSGPQPLACLSGV